MFCHILISFFSPIIANCLYLSNGAYNTRCFFTAKYLKNSKWFNLSSPHWMSVNHHPERQLCVMQTCPRKCMQVYNLFVFWIKCLRIYLDGKAATNNMSMYRWRSPFLYWKVMTLNWTSSQYSSELFLLSLQCEKRKTNSRTRGFKDHKRHIYLMNLPHIVIELQRVIFIYCMLQNFLIEKKPSISNIISCYIVLWSWNKGRQKSGKVTIWGES